MADEFTEQLIDAGLRELLRLRLVLTVRPTLPAAGAEFVATVPAGVIWELIGLQATLTASAVVANRQPSLLVRDADQTQLARFGQPGTVTASTGATIEWWAGLGMTATVGPQMSGLPAPPLVLTAGAQLRSLTGGLDAGDQWSALVLTVRQWSPADVVQQAQWVARSRGALTITN